MGFFMNEGKMKHEMDGLVQLVLYQTTVVKKELSQKAKILFWRLICISPFTCGGIVKKNQCQCDTDV